MLRPRSFWAVLLFFTISTGVTPAQTAPKKKEAQPAKDLYGDPLPAGAIARCGTIRFRHEGDVWWVALSPDGKLAASASSDGLIYVWDVTTGKLLHRVRAFAGGDLPGGHAFELSPDGRILAAMNPGVGILLWDVTTSQQIRKFKGALTHGSKAVRFSPDGKILATAEGGYVTLLDASTGKEIRDFVCPPEVEGLAFSPDGKTLAVGMQPRAAQLWDVASGKLRHGIEGDVGFGYAVAFSPDAKMLASGGFNRIILSEAATGKELGQLYTLMEWIQFLAFLPDGKTVVSYSTEGAVRFWDVATRRQRLQLGPEQGPLRTAAVSRNGKIVAAAAGKRIRLWETGSGSELFAEVSGHDGLVHSVAFAPDGKTLASAGDNEPIRLWETATGKHRRQLKSDRADKVLFGPDGKRLVSLWSANKTMRLWNAATGEPLLKMTELDGELEEISWSGQSKTLVSVDWRESPDATDRHSYHFRVWDVATARPLREFWFPLTFESRPRPVAFAEDGTRIALQSGFASIQVWNLERAKDVVTLRINPEDILVIAFSPTGQTVATGGSGGTVHLWEVASGQEILALRGHRCAVMAIAFSADGRLLASGSGSDSSGGRAPGPHEIRLWDLPSRKQLHQFQGHESNVSSLAFSPDSNRLASGLMNSAILVWDLAPLAPTARLPGKELSPRDLEKLWADLAGQDAFKAHQAIWTLSAAPAQTLPLLKGRLKPAEATDPKRIRKLIADLDHNKFAVRKTATRELEALAEEAEEALRQALKQSPSLELRRRVEAILAAPQAVRAPEAMRRIRAIQVLERIASRDAQAILQTLAKGRNGARETLDAKAALERLTERR